jgi:hypothetical protein
VLGNGQTGHLTGFQEDNVTTSLAVNDPTGFLEDFNGLRARQNDNFGINRVIKMCLYTLSAAPGFEQIAFPFVFKGMIRDQDTKKSVLLTFSTTC